MLTDATIARTLLQLANQIDSIHQVMDGEGLTIPAQDSNELGELIGLLTDEVESRMPRVVTCWKNGRQTSFAVENVEEAKVIAKRQVTEISGHTLVEKSTVWLPNGMEPVAVFKGGAE